MRKHRYVLPQSLVLAAALAVAVAGCGGSSSASSASPPHNAASTSPGAKTTPTTPGAKATTTTTTTTPGATTPSNTPKVPLSTPQSAVQAYIEGVSAVNGAAICNALDANLEHKIIQEIVRARPSEARSSCAQALTGLVSATTNPSERGGKLPTFHVSTTGNTAVVKYVGTRTHHHHTFTLVKQGSGWLVDKVNENE